MDFWRLMVSASFACQVLIKCRSIDWNSPRGDLIKRTYWHCAIMEMGLHLELDLPSTGIIGLEYRVGIPSFNNPFCEADYRGNHSSHFEAHYASQVALWRLYTNLYNNINDSMTNTASSSDGFGGPTPSSLKQLASKLTQWRGMLPRDLHRCPWVVIVSHWTQTYRHTKGILVCPSLLQIWIANLCTILTPMTYK
jgi:hypothetical protein